MKIKLVVSFLTIIALLFFIHPVHALDEGATCTFNKGEQVCTGTIQEGSCKTDKAIDENCQKSGTADQVFGHVSVPAPIARIGLGAKGISIFLTNAVGLIYTAAGVLFLIMIVWAAFQWISAGGDKEALNKARQRIINAIIGILLLALAGVFFQIFGHITGFNFIK